MADDLVKLRAENAELRSQINTVQIAAKYAAKIRDERIEKLEAALRLIAQNDYGLQGMIEDGTDTPENKAEYYAGQVNRRRYVARKALEGKDD